MGRWTVGRRMGGGSTGSACVLNAWMESFASVLSGVPTRLAHVCRVLLLMCIYDKRVILGSPLGFRACPSFVLTVDAQLFHCNETFQGS